ncbi:MAG: SAM-dependent methyltransferase [Methylococcales bacterium]
MSFTLDKIVPWGRSYAEYLSMFNLSDVDLSKRIVGCGDGPAGFNAEFSQRGGQIVSVDPIYCFDTAQLSSRIEETYETVMAQTRQNQGNFLWHTIANMDELGKIRMSAMQMFLADYEIGKSQGRYIAGELPVLPISNQAFELAISSHFLFLYSEHLSADFHKQALLEMLRVAAEVRVFPLLTLNTEPSPYLTEIMAYPEGLGFSVDIQPVAYEFQRGANRMLVIKTL